MTPVQNEIDKLICCCFAAGVDAGLPEQWRHLLPDRDGGVRICDHPGVHVCCPGVPALQGTRPAPAHQGATVCS